MPLAESSDRRGAGEVRCVRCELSPSRGLGPIVTGDDVEVRFMFSCPTNRPPLRFTVYDGQGVSAAITACRIRGRAKRGRGGAGQCSFLFRKRLAAAAGKLHAQRGVTSWRSAPRACCRDRPTRGRGGPASADTAFPQGPGISNSVGTNAHRWATDPNGSVQPNWPDAIGVGADLPMDTLSLNKGESRSEPDRSDLSESSWYDRPVIDRLTVIGGGWPVRPSRRECHDRDIRRLAASRSGKATPRRLIRTRRCDRLAAFVREAAETRPHRGPGAGMPVPRECPYSGLVPEDVDYESADLRADRETVRRT